MTHTKHTPWEAVPFAGAWAVRDSRNSPIVSGLSESTARLIAASPATAAERDRLREVNADLLAALRKIGYEPFGPADATHAEVLQAIEDFARALLARLDNGPQNDVQAAIGGLTQTPMEW